MNRIVLVLLTVAACGQPSAPPPPPAADPRFTVDENHAIAYLQKFRDRMCACTDSTCIGTVAAEVADANKALPKRDAYSPGFLDVAKPLFDELKTCGNKFTAPAAPPTK